LIVFKEKEFSQIGFLGPNADQISAKT